MWGSWAKGNTLWTGVSFFASIIALDFSCSLELEGDSSVGTSTSSKTVLSWSSSSSSSSWFFASFSAFSTWESIPSKELLRVASRISSFRLIIVLSSASFADGSYDRTSCKNWGATYAFEKRKTTSYYTYGIFNLHQVVQPWIDLRQMLEFHNLIWLSQFLE